MFIGVRTTQWPVERFDDGDCGVDVSFSTTLSGRSISSYVTKNERFVIVMTKLA